ncbi:MAG: response regulator [Pseudomonadales bacterium]|nr:response regulator [Pseudomonadales bacterium]
MSDLDHLAGAGIDRLLEGAPIGIVALDSEGRVVSANHAARVMLSCDQGEPFVRYIHQDSRERFDRLVAEPRSSVELQLALDVGTKFAEVTCIPVETGDTVLFIADVSEKVALSRQLMSTRLPSRRLLHALQTANTTMGGYHELIGVMLEEEAVVAGERLTVIKRYHKEILRSLETVDRLLKMERLGGKRPDATTIPLNRKQVVVIDDETAIAEFIAELMRGMRHKVTTFADAGEALAFCIENGPDLHLVIVDHRMPVLSGTEFIERLHARHKTLPVILCTDDASLSSNAEDLTYLCHKPLDINELTRMVGELID